MRKVRAMGTHLLLASAGILPLLSGRLGAQDGALPAGEYGCYTYNPKSNYVGTLTISGDRYQSRTGASGRYRGGSDGRVEFLGEAPLGFRAGVLEEREPPKLRLYASAADIGNKWRAAVCTRKAGSGGASAAPAAPSAGGAFRAGEHIQANFFGYWYGATIVRCDGDRCLLRYDDSKWKDEWADTTRFRRD